MKNLINCIRCSALISLTQAMFPPFSEIFKVYGLVGFKQLVKFAMCASHEGPSVHFGELVAQRRACKHPAPAKLTGEARRVKREQLRTLAHSMNVRFHLDAKSVDDLSLRALNTGKSLQTLFAGKITSMRLLAAKTAKAAKTLAAKAA